MPDNREGYRSGLNLPDRPTNALSGSAFVQSIMGLEGVNRDRAITQQILNGNVPDSMRQLHPVQMGPVTIYVTPDYVAVGSNEDSVRVPVGLDGATYIAGEAGAMLPTRAMVNAIWQQADTKLSPRPMNPTSAMTSTRYFTEHDATIDGQLAGVTKAGLIAGNKKDIVTTERLGNGSRVPIYGWHQSNGAAIQPLSTVHGADYADYSHGVRLVSAHATVNGEMVPLRDLLADPQYARYLSDEGALSPTMMAQHFGKDVPEPILVAAAEPEQTEVASNQPFVSTKGTVSETPEPAEAAETKKNEPAKVLQTSGYAVQAGDTLSKIAARELGDSGRWREIYEQNKDVIGANPNQIQIGMQLTIGEMVELQQEQQQQEADKKAEAATAEHEQHSSEPAAQVNEAAARAEAADTDMQAVRTAIKDFVSQGLDGNSANDRSAVEGLRKALGVDEAIAFSNPEGKRRAGDAHDFLRTADYDKALSALSGMAEEGISKEDLEGLRAVAAELKLTIDTDAVDDTVPGELSPNARAAMQKSTSEQLEK